MTTKTSRPFASPQSRQTDRARVALVLGVLLYSTAVAVVGRGLDPLSIGLGLRLQARLSFLLFVAALSGRGLQALVGSAMTTWLARNRSSVYLGFALSHLIHGGWIILFYTFTPEDFSGSAADISGVIAFPLIALLLFAETQAGGRSLGVWRTRFETAIVAYVWVQFVGFFIDRLTYGRPELHAWYIAAICISVAAGLLALRGSRIAQVDSDAWSPLGSRP